MNYDEEEPFDKHGEAWFDSPESFRTPYSRIVTASGYVVTEYFNGQGVPAPDMGRLRFRLLSIGHSAMETDIQYN